MKVFVIVVTYNGTKWYDYCFRSLIDSTIPLDILAIDNASTDGTCEYIRQHFPEVTLLPQNKNLGFGQANNLGMKLALGQGADYVFLLNQDAWIEPGTVDELIKVSKDHPEYGILSCMHLNKEKTRIWQLNCICNDQITDPSLYNDTYFSVLKEVYDTKYVNAAAWLLPRKTIETVGGFDPIFFHYGESMTHASTRYSPLSTIPIPTHSTISTTTSAAIMPKPSTACCVGVKQHIMPIWQTIVYCENIATL